MLAAGVRPLGVRPSHLVATPFPRFHRADPVSLFGRRKSKSPDRPAPPDPIQVVLGYHQRTKHDHGRFARALGYLDWDSQPDPFRSFDGAPRVALAIPGRSDGPPLPAVPYGDIYRPGAVTAAPLDGVSVSSFLFHALALSASKSTGETSWSLRVDPSSGNLHPTEGWLVLPAVDGLHDGPALWHYAPKDHALERRADLAADPTLPAGAFGIALSSVPWREAWKYGERAFRYCQHDVGHAFACLALSASLHGWKLHRAGHVGDGALSSLLGLDRDDAWHDGEREVPDLLAVVAPHDTPLDVAAFAQVDAGAWGFGATFHGEANVLSTEHHPWDLIDVVEHASTRGDGATSQPADLPVTPEWLAPLAPPVAEAPSSLSANTAVHDSVASPVDASEATSHPPAPERLRASTVIRGRRSAVAMDGVTTMSRDAFFSLLARCTPALTPWPAAALSAPTRMHPVLFVHRVDDVDPGLYLLLRDASAESDLREHLRDDFTFARPDGLPDALPLFRLAAGDVRGRASGLSCGQAIAADGAFAVAMLADLGGGLGSEGPPAYRTLHWEAGLLGQVLYLEAEAHGLRATGIGCFFDDPTHAALGLDRGRFQTLYHFTVGGPVDDERLTTEPPYGDRT